LKKALVLAIVMVLGLGTLAFAGPLSGGWDTEICFGVLSYEGDGFLYGIGSLDSKLTIDYSVCGWEFESVSEFGLGGWETQVFTVDGVLGAFSFASTLEFDPAVALFELWDSTMGLSIAGIQIDANFILVPWGSGWVFDIAGTAGLCDLSATAYFNIWPFEITYADLVALYGGSPWFGEFVAEYFPEGHTQTSSVTVTTPLPGYCLCFNLIEFETSFPFCCVEEVNMSVSFSQFGFEGVTFSVSAIELPISWLTLDAELSFYEGEMLGKELTITPGLNLGDVFCFDIYADLVVDGGLIDGLNIYGIGLTCDMGQGVIFESISVLDWPYHHVTADGIEETGLLTPVDSLCCGADASYWERFSISSSSDACCGGAFGFDLDVYFGSDFEIVVGDLLVYECVHPWLFDIARIDAEFSVGLGSNVALSAGVSLVDLYYDDEAGCTPFGLSEFCIGFEVTF
jgi:hypothetical protein